MSINDPRLSAFQSNLYPVGLDLGRCVINTDLGVLQAATTATFNAGSIVAQNASGEIVPCVGNTATVPTGVPLGVAKWNKALSYFAAAQDERVTLTGVVVSNLKHANIFNDGGLAGLRVTSGGPDRRSRAAREGEVRSPKSEVRSRNQACRPAQLRIPNSKFERSVLPQPFRKPPHPRLVRLVVAEEDVVGEGGFVHGGEWKV